MAHRLLDIHAIPVRWQGTIRSLAGSMGYCPNYGWGAAEAPPSISGLLLSSLTLWVARPEDLGSQDRASTPGWCSVPSWSRPPEGLRLKSQIMLSTIVGAELHQGLHSLVLGRNKGVPIDQITQVLFWIGQLFPTWFAAVYKVESERNSFTINRRMLLKNAPAFCFLPLAAA